MFFNSFTLSKAKLRFCVCARNSVHNFTFTTEAIMTLFFKPKGNMIMSFNIIHVMRRENRKEEKYQKTFLLKPPLSVIHYPYMLLG